MRGRKIKLKPLPPSAMPLGALYVCDDCTHLYPKGGYATAIRDQLRESVIEPPPPPMTYDATRAAYHRRNTGHRMTLVMEIS